MKLHSDFLANKKSAGWIARALNQPDIRDGAYARVGGLQQSEVLKATICDATNALFESLLKRAKKGLTVPEALPAVFKRHGPVVQDADGLTYIVWSIERLFEPVEKVAMRRARIADKSGFIKLKPGYLLPGANLGSGDLTALRQALAQEQRSCRTPNTWEGSADIALAMSLRTEGQLRETFRFLLDFVYTQQVQLDLLTRGNVLLNLFGQPSLGDPVCAADPEAQEAQPLQGTCLAALLPARVRGATLVTLEPTSTLPLHEQELAGLEDSLQCLGLLPQRFQWGSTAHRKFLSQDPVLQALRDIPDVTKNLRADRYQQLFSA